MVIGQTERSIDNLEGSDLSLKQLIEIAKNIQSNPQLGAQTQSQLLRRVSKKIWQRSVCEYDGY